MTELLAPAGNPEKLRWAAAYGADAVYFGCKSFSLRNFAGNFTEQEACEGLEYLHSHGKKGYATLNVYPRTNEYPQLLKTAGDLAAMHVDGFIVSDLGVMSLLRKNFPKIGIHVSTQANTVSAQAALFYHGMGAVRVNLARELSFEEIDEINYQTKGKIETEVFVHGSVCFSYSGRCAISDYLASRGANQGMCAQSCRWKYNLVEETRPGEFLPVFEDNRGLYLFNSRDIALYGYVRKLIESGTAALKIEGRMKNIHYLASVLSVYRKLIDGHEMSQNEILPLLSRISNRRYSDGFMKSGKVSAEDYSPDLCGYQATSEFVAHSTCESIRGMRKCVIKNSINAGEKLEMLTTDGCVTEVVMPSPLLSENMEPAQRLHNCHTLLLDSSVPPYAIFRRVITQ